jgi:hypothetical protein
MSTELDFEINAGNLDRHLQQLPNDLLVWTREASARVRRVTIARNRLKLVEAKTSIDIRTNPVAYGHAKVTEDLVKALVIVQPEFQTAQDEVAEAEDELFSARAVVDALESKRSSLKYLAELTVSGYLGSTNISTSVSQPKGVRN